MNCGESSLHVIASLRRIRWATWRPKLVETWPSYDRQSFISDLIAGLTVGVVALPLAMAFGIASGVTPQAGIYTAIVGGFLVSLFGGSRIQIGGPTGAFVVIVAGIIAAHGISGLLMVTMMAGVILVVLALTGLGQAVKFIPRPVVVGFTNGIALLIASTQIKDFFGLAIPEPPREFFSRMAALAHGMPDLNVIALTLAAGVAGAGAADSAMAATGTRIDRRPGGWHRCRSSLSPAGRDHRVEVRRHSERLADDCYSSIPRGPHSPAAASGAHGRAAGGGREPALGSRLRFDDRRSAQLERRAPGSGCREPGVAARRRHSRHGSYRADGDQLSIGCALAGCGLVHAITLLVIIVLLAPLAAFVPLATLAAILFVVAYNMGEWRHIGRIWRLEWADKSVWMITFALTVMADLTVAVEVGMALAALLYIHRVTSTTIVSTLSREDIEDGRVHILQDRQVPAYVTILRIHGPFLFGMTDKLVDATADLSRFAPIVILRLRNMPAIDATGLHALETLSDRLQRTGRALILCGAREQPAAFLHQAEFVEHVGADNIVPHVEAALARAQEVWARGPAQFPKVPAGSLR